jgi:hypothetical protein
MLADDKTEGNYGNPADGIGEKNIWQFEHN